MVRHFCDACGEEILNENYYLNSHFSFSKKIGKKKVGFVLEYFGALFCPKCLLETIKEQVDYNIKKYFSHEKNKVTG